MNERKYIEMINAERARHTGAVLNAYVCPECGERTVTIDRDAGTTPFMMPCPKCNPQNSLALPMMVSQMYQVAPEPPTGEFYRPSFADFRKMPDGAEKQHVADGGLLFRKIPPPPANIHAENAAKGKCAVQMTETTFCPNDGNIHVNLFVMFSDNTEGEIPAKVCLEHAIRQAVRRMIEQANAMREQKRLANSKMLGSAARYQPKTVLTVTDKDGKTTDISASVKDMRFSPSGECRNCLYDKGKVMKYCDACLEDAKIQ